VARSHTADQGASAVTANPCAEPAEPPPRPTAADRVDVEPGQGIQVGRPARAGELLGPGYRSRIRLTAFAPRPSADLALTVSL